MRILHVTVSLWRCNGVMSVIMNYLRGMPEDIRFDILYFDERENNYKEELQAMGGQAYRIARPGLHSFGRDGIDEFLEAHGKDYAAIHLHLPYLASIFAPKARRAGIPKVYVHCHSTVFALEARNTLRNWVFNLPTKRLSDQLFACGRDAGIFWYGRRAFEQGRVTVLPNAIGCDGYRFSPERREAARIKLGVENQLIVGHVGQANCPQKNHPFLLRVFAEIVRKRTDAVLLLIGAAQNERLTALIEELGIAPYVRWLGLRSDVADLLQAMDVFVCPSTQEGVPVSVVEAQAAGLPVLISDTVTDEVCCVPERTCRMSLRESADRWADKALELAGFIREDTADWVMQSGFDLSQSAAKLAQLYRR